MTNPAPSLKISLIDAPLTSPLLSGQVEVDGFGASFTPGKSVDDNSRRMLHGEFDVAEMSLATFLYGYSHSVPIRGLPVFTGRRFLQSAVLCNRASGIQAPEDFVGKKVGLPQFWMTSSVWHRGILQEQHGVAQDAVDWVTFVEERFDDVATPPGVNISHQPGDNGSLETALLANKVDAIMTPGRGRGSIDPNLIRPYPDVVEAQRAYFQSTQVFPIMHFVVVRQELADEHPSLVPALFSAFVAAKAMAVRQNGSALPVDGFSPEQSVSLLGADPWPYGLHHNLRPLETFLRFARDQGLFSAGLQVEDLFVPSAVSLKE